MSAQPADEAEDQSNLTSQHTLIARASSELESDPDLKREVLFALLRSLAEARQPRPQ